MKGFSVAWNSPISRAEASGSGVPEPTEAGPEGGALMAKKEKGDGERHVPIPRLGGRERHPSEERPSDRQTPANRPAAPPKEDKK